MNNKNRYNNIDNVSIQPSFSSLLQWQKERRSKSKDLSFVMPQAVNKQVDFLNTNRTEVSVTWIGHATVLIQAGGCNIITDPVWANRMGLQKRIAPPGLLPTELPPVDFVLISHNHYDHLDFNSLRLLKGEPLHLVPAGLGKSFIKKGFNQVEEFQWWDEKRSGSLSITFVPAQHWSRRTLWDTNKSLWGGWVICSDKKCIYFAGDSGYFRGFKEIGQKYEIDYVLMPIGAYEPEWFMQLQHVSPEDAVRAYIDLKAAHFIPIHFEAFRLGDDAPLEALQRLKKEWAAKNLDPSKLKLLELGETIKG